VQTIANYVETDFVEIDAGIVAQGTDGCNFNQGIVVRTLDRFSCGETTRQHHNEDFQYTM